MQLNEITFLIGNGFDISCDLKTKYCDIYASYIDSKPKSAVVQDFQNNLKNYLDSDGAPLWAHWADFEMGLAEYAKTLSSEGELLECLEDFTKVMIQHLASEEKRFITRYKEDKLYHSIAVTVVLGSIDGFQRKLTRRKSIDLFDSASLGDPLFYNFITFNYTRILETVLPDVEKDQRLRDARVVFRKPIHIHGTLTEGLTLGVDNLEQLNEMSYPVSSAGKYALVKPLFNSVYNENKVQSVKDTIKRSNVLCIFGLSLGDSDLSWRRVIREWIQQSNDHQIVFFGHKYSEQKGLLPWRKVLAEENAINDILQRLEFTDEGIQKHKQQIHIPIGESIFDVPSSYTVARGLDGSRSPSVASVE